MLGKPQTIFNVAKNFGTKNSNIGKKEFNKIDDPMIINQIKT